MIHGKRFKTVNRNGSTLGSSVKFWLLGEFVTPRTNLNVRLSTIRVLPVYVDTKDA